MSSPAIILASTSPYRRALLERLGLAFRAVAPGIDETPSHGELPQALVMRLAEAKARALVRDYPRALIIGSDQVACIDGQILGKPGDRANAIAQLERLSGREVIFHTGLCLLDTQHNRAETLVEPFRVFFRPLTSAQIAGYVDREQPFDCAGSFKSEGLGIALFERLEGEDPNTLIGLPLIRLIRLLEAKGIDLLRPVPED